MMKKTGWILLLIGHFYALAANTPIESLIQTKRAAVTVSGVRLYADSTYTKPTEDIIAEGELLEIIAETQREHYDNTENQTFKWFKINEILKS